jgi:c-di-GMP-binding flagellar brake protein YcgR
MGSMDQRKFQRFSDNSVVTFSGETVKGNGRLDNLSLGGAAILSDSKISRGDYLSLAISLPAQEDTIEVELAPVRWVKDSSFGVEFIRIAPEPQQRLKQYINSLEQTSSNAA